MEQYKEFPYTSQILNYLLERSKIHHNKTSFDYLAQIQNNKITPKNREQAICWLSDICEKHSFSAKTQQLSITYLDLILCQKSIPDISILELLTYICLSLGLKYEETRFLSFQEIFHLCKGKFTLETIKTTQVYILNLFQWELEIPTPSEIMAYLLLNTCESFQWDLIKKQAEAFILAAQCDYDISREHPFHISIASTLCVFENWKFGDFASEWLDSLSASYGLDISYIKETSKKIWEKITAYNN